MRIVVLSLFRHLPFLQVKGQEDKGRPIRVVKIHEDVGVEKTTCNRVVSSFTTLLSTLLETMKKHKDQIKMDILLKSKEMRQPLSSACVEMRNALWPQKYVPTICRFGTEYGRAYHTKLLNDVCKSEYFKIPSC